MSLVTINGNQYDVRCAKNAIALQYIIEESKRNNGIVPKHREEWLRFRLDMIQCELRDAVEKKDRKEREAQWKWQFDADAVFTIDPVCLHSHPCVHSVTLHGKLTSMNGTCIAAYYASQGQAVPPHFEEYQYPPFRGMFLHAVNVQASDDDESVEDE